MKLLTVIAAAGAATAIAIPKHLDARLHEDEEALFLIGQDGAGQQVPFHRLNHIGERKLMPGPNDKRAVEHFLGRDGAGQQKHLLGQGGAGQQKHLLGQDGAGQHLEKDTCLNEVMQDVSDLVKIVSGIEKAVSDADISGIANGIKEAVQEIKKIKTTLTHCKKSIGSDNVDLYSSAVDQLTCIKQVSDLVATTHLSVSNGFMANQARDSMGMQQSMNDIKFILESIQTASRMCNAPVGISGTCLVDLENVVHDLEGLTADATAAVKSFSVPSMLKVVNDLRMIKNDIVSVVADCNSKPKSEEQSFSNAIVGPMRLEGNSCDEKHNEILLSVTDMAESLLAAAEKLDVDAIHSIVSTRVAGLIPTVGGVLSTCQ